MFCNIEAERVRNNLTQEEFSKQLGVERRTYYSWQLNDKIPTSKLIEISKMFNCSIDYLLGLTRNPKINE